MTSSWLLPVLFLIYPVILIKLNALVRRKIPEKNKRKEFKRKKEYVIKVVYLLAPLILFHLELIYLNAGYSLNQFSTISLIFLFMLQVFLLFNAIISLYRLILELNNFNN